MWKEYSWNSVRNNRGAAASVIVAAFISALLLSLLCSLFYNFWTYEIEGIYQSEGDWHGRLSGAIDEEAFQAIRSYANVKSAVKNEELSDEQNVVVDIRFDNIRTILTDMPKIAELAGLGPEAVSYHYTLLNLYLVRDPNDPAPRLIFPFFLAITAMACLSLVLIIHNSFALSMNARLRQFGIFSSIGATPGQIRTCLLQEAALVCAIPVLAGNLLGLLLSIGVIELTNRMLSDVEGRQWAVWGYHPLVFVFTILITIATIWFSALLPAWKLSKMTPLNAIKGSDEFQLQKKKRISSMGFLFGIEGELAENSLRAQRKALHTATLSLTFAFLAFTLMQCFLTLSKISQRMTYYEKYQNAWDIMVTVKDTGLDEIQETNKLQALPGIRSCFLYQKESAKTQLHEDELSEDFLRLGGFQAAPESYVQMLGDFWRVDAPLLILDDHSFLAYCRQIGAPERLDGAVVINRILDFTNPNFRQRDRLSYLNDEKKTTVLYQAEHEEVKTEIPVIFHTQELPVLREEYGTLNFYELVHVLPLSTWKEIKEQIAGTENDTYIRILAAENVTPKELNQLTERISQLLGTAYETETENRIQDKQNNDRMIDGMMLIFGGFCVLLATIGIGNVFSTTLSFARQRKRELARYLSIGMTTAGIKKIFCIEALIIAGRPVLLTLPITIVLIGFMLDASYLEPILFSREAPILPVLLFILAILGSVTLAYYLGGKKALQCDLAAVLRDNTFV